MATKRPNLANISRAAGIPESRLGASQNAPEPSSAGEGRAGDQRPSRAGKSFVGGYFPPEVRRQIKTLAAEHDKTVQQLVGEALNSLFASYGKAEIAPTTRE